MQYTTHYNLNLPEGTDIVNPLVQDNPNYTAIDTALYNNKVRTVGNATEVKSGTVHAITRGDSDIDVMKFTATGDWITGDTMTVDGTPVSVYLQDGTAPLTGAYVINTEVVAVLNGSRVTLYGAQKLPGYTASDISYDNTVSGLAATDVKDAIDEVSADIAQIETDYHYLSKQYETVMSFTSNADFTVPQDGLYVFTTDAPTVSDARRINIGRLVYITLASPLVLALKKDSVIGILSTADNPIQLFRIH